MTVIPPFTYNSPLACISGAVCLRNFYAYRLCLRPLGLWWSALLGGVLGLCYIGASVLAIWLARRTIHFLVVVIGGMLLRMAAALAALVFVVLLFPVSISAFIGTFLSVFLAGLIIEVVWLLRRNQ